MSKEQQRAITALQRDLVTNIRMVGNVDSLLGLSKIVGQLHAPLKNVVLPVLPTQAAIEAVLPKSLSPDFLKPFGNLDYDTLFGPALKFNSLSLQKSLGLGVRVCSAIYFARGAL